MTSRACGIGWHGLRSRDRGSPTAPHASGKEQDRDNKDQGTGHGASFLGKSLATDCTTPAIPASPLRAFPCKARRKSAPFPPRLSC